MDILKQWGGFLLSAGRARFVENNHMLMALQLHVVLEEAEDFNP